TADYKVVLEPQAIIVGTVNEDFAVESMAGDIFQLGNSSYRIQRVDRDRQRERGATSAPSTGCAKNSASTRPPPSNSSIIWPARKPHWACCRASAPSCWNASSTNPAAPSW